MKLFFINFQPFLSRGLNNHNFTSSAATFQTPGSPTTTSSSYTNHKQSPPPPPQSSKSSPFLVTATVPNHMGHKSSDQLRFEFVKLKKSS